jgi:oxygen-independent coproporphyrinogen-3 oxidase
MLHIISADERGQREGPSPETLAAGRPASLYIHIPFCFHKCHYCDFYSIVDDRGRMEAFTERLCAELRAISTWSRGVTLETIFVGGGTPTLLPPEHWETLLSELRASFDLSRLARDGEFTVECNPETASPGLFATLAAGGVNRLSLGAQSFDPRHLATLERWHDPENVGRAIDLARAAGIARLSVDLIYAIPGQTVSSVADDLERAVRLGVEHVSAYSLTYEPGTAMTARLAREEFEPMDEDTDAEMMRTVRDVLGAAGFRRYEVSNFARPGAECRHNLAYWRQREWLAAGPSASAHVGGHRWKNVPRLGTYLSTSFAGRSPVTDHETPDPARALAERVMTGLRLCEGLDAAATLTACRAIRPGLAGEVSAAIDRLRGEGLLLGRGPGRVERWVLSDAGVLVADRIAAGMMAVIDP